MALDDLIKYGKQAIKAEGLGERFRQDSSLNVALAVAELRGLNRENPNAYAVIVESSPDMAPARQRQTLEGYVSEVASKVVAEVQSDFSASVGAITRDEILQKYLLQIKPSSYSGANDEIFRVYEGAFKANQMLRTEGAVEQKAQEYSMEIVQDLVSKNVESALINAVQWCFARNPGIAVKAVQSKAMVEIEAFREKFVGDEAKKYVTGMYGSQSDQDKKGLAYVIGKAVAESN